MINRASNISNEQSLAALCSEGDRVAQRALYDTYAEYLLLVAYRYIPGGEDAREVMMDGMVDAYKNIGRFTWMGEGSLRAWLKKLVVNRSLMFLRKKNAGHIPIDETGYEGASTDTDAISQLSVKELLALIHELPDGYRTVFNLYIFDGMTHKEIGKVLNISENSSKSQLHKAKALLQKQITNN